MTYPEFKDRLLEDIPYEEYTAAMNGFLRYASTKYPDLKCDLECARVGGLGYEGKNTHERPSEKRQQLSAISCTSLNWKKGWMRSHPTTCLPIQQKQRQQSTELSKKETISLWTKLTFAKELFRNFYPNKFHPYIHLKAYKLSIYKFALFLTNKL